MWRRISALVAVVAIAAGAVAGAYWLFDGGGGSPSSAFDIDACVASKGTPPPTWTIEEAKRRYDWIRFPSELPPDATVSNVWPLILGCDLKAAQIVENIHGPGYRIDIIQQRVEPAAPRTPRSYDPTPEPRTPFTVDGSPGTVVGHPPAMYFWLRDGVRYDVFVRFGGSLTAEDVLTMLNSMK